MLRLKDEVGRDGLLELRISNRVSNQQIHTAEFLNHSEPEKPEQSTEREAN